MAGGSETSTPTMRAWKDPAVSTGGGGKGGASAPLSQTNYGANRFVGNPGMQRGANWAPKTYAPPMMGQGSPSFGTGGPVMGGGYAPGGFGQGGGGYGEASPSESGGGFSLGGNMGPGGSSALGNLGLSPGMSGLRGYAVGGPLGGLMGGLLGYGSELGRAGDPTNSSSVNAVNGMDAMSDAYSGGAGGFGGGHSGPDGGRADGGPGEGTGEGGGWAKGGKVTKKRLVGPDPKGPDDGYGALDEGEVVIPASIVRKLAKKKG